MQVWPSSLTYGEEDYGWSVAPDVQRSVHASNATRQRRLGRNRDDIFTITLRLDETGLASFNAFIESIGGGADEYAGPYYVSDAEYTGTLQIVDGVYNVSYLSENYWSVTFEVQIKDRNMDNELNLYNLAVATSGFSLLCDLISATEQAVNFNNL